MLKAVGQKRSLREVRVQPALAPEHPLLKTLVQAVSDIIASSCDGLAMQGRYEELSRLTHWELARRGLTRADIAHLVVNGESEPQRSHSGSGGNLRRGDKRVSVTAVSLSVRA
jgi:hypothetical protein